MKEKLMGRMGKTGLFLYYGLALVVSVAPLVMINTSFFVKLILLGIMQFIPATSGLFWFWGLVCAIRGPQDAIAIIYYVLFAIIFIPFYLNGIIDIANLWRK